LKQVPGTTELSLPDKLEALGQAREGLIDGAATFVHWDALASAPLLGGWPVTCNLLAALITLAVTGLAYWGIKESARGNAVLVLLKLAVLLGVVGCGAWFIDTANWTPFAPGGFRGVHAGAAIMFFAFVGFDSISTLSEECRNPGRSLPRGILYSLLICTTVYVIVAAVVTGMVKYDRLAGIGDPLAFIFAEHQLHGLAAAASIGALIATTTAVLAYQVAQPRVMLSMSRDGLLGPWFGRISPKRGTPSHATWLTGGLVAVPASLLNLEEVVELTNIGTLFAFMIVCVGILVLRVRRPEAPRPFRVPCAWVLIPLGLGSCALLMAALPVITWIRFGLWLGLGLVVYVLYGSSRSRVARIGKSAAG
jgi:APA family basic amino acid/polyamine antiporter